MTLVGILKIFLPREEDEIEHVLQNLLYKMFLIGRDVIFVIAIIFTVIAVLTNSQSHIRRVPPPKPFFAQDTWVDDFYEGKLYYALLKASKYDVVFLMLYAPWDADSQKARAEFETACRYFHKKIYCAAVNCWQTTSDCKSFFSNINTYPIFFVDLHGLAPVRYNGEYVSSHMIRFLNAVVNPLKRIKSIEEFFHLSSTCDVLLSSYLPVFHWYKLYYTHSLRYLEYDPRADICWSFVTDANLAEVLDLKPVSMKMYLWNVTKELDGSFADKNVIKWVYDSTQFLTQWVFFRNAPNYLLSDLLETNPAVILFTPRNMHLDNIPSYLLFKEAALEYSSCFTEVAASTRQTYIEEKHADIIEDYWKWERLCKDRYNSQLDIVSATFDEGAKVNSTFHTDRFHNSTLSSENTFFSSHTSQKSTPAANVLFDENEDNRSPRNLVLLHIRERCRNQRLLKRKYQYSYFSNGPREKAPSSVHIERNDLCSLNRTYTFFAVDSLLYSHFSRALGLNLNQFKDRTAVVIVNNKNEEVFILPEHFNDKSVLLKFMIDVGKRYVSRWMKSTADTEIYPHLYRKPPEEEDFGDDFSVPELNSDTFQSVVFNESQHVVLYYYTPFCSYCQVSAYTFLTVSYLLRNYSHIKFARIDGDNNDLPWHLSPQSYPSIIVFPAENKSESKIFPITTELTVENLLHFVLSNVDVEIELQFMIRKCQEYRTTEHKSSHIVFEECISEAKNYCMTLINKLISSYAEIGENLSPNANISVVSESFYTRLKRLKVFYLNLENTYS